MPSESGTCQYCHRFYHCPLYCPSPPCDAYLAHVRASCLWFLLKMQPRTCSRNIWRESALISFLICFPTATCSVRICKYSASVTQAHCLPAFAAQSSAMGMTVRPSHEKKLLIKEDTNSKDLRQEGDQKMRDREGDVVGFSVGTQQSLCHNTPLFSVWNL